MMKEMKEKELTPHLFAVVSFPRFLEAAVALCVPSLEHFPESVLQQQYRNYIMKVAMLADEQSGQTIDSIIIASKLYSEKEKLFDDIQVVLHIAAYAATKSSCESIVESYISQYEDASDARKNFKEESITDVFEIIRNGPLPSQCDKVVKMALNRYRLDQKNMKLHFVTNDVFAKSTVIKRMEKESSMLSFMD